MATLSVTAMKVFDDPSWSECLLKCAFSPLGVSVASHLDFSPTLQRLLRVCAPQETEDGFPSRVCRLPQRITVYMKPETNLKTALLGLNACKSRNSKRRISVFQFATRAADHCSAVAGEQQAEREREEALSEGSNSQIDFW